MGDLVQVLELAYAPHADTESWLSTVGRAIDGFGPSLKSFPMAVAYTYQVVPDAPVRISNFRRLRGDEEGSLSVQRTAERLTCTGAQRWYGAEIGFRSAARTLAEPQNREALARMCGQLGGRDFLALNCADADGRGVVVGWIADRAPRLPVSSRALEQVAAHVAAAYRLHATAAPIAAILDAERVVHAEGEARATTVRESLERATARFDRARSRLKRRDPEASLALWTALVGERYSLCERIDSDGRRLIEARDNPCRPEAPQPLSARERQVLAYLAMGHSNKLVGYELGLSQSAVATYATRIRKKIGAGSRVEVVRAGRSVDARVAAARLRDVDLTSAESEVALMVLDGCSNAEIARRRGTKLRTVANQVASVFAKVGVTSRTELAARLLD